MRIEERLKRLENALPKPNYHLPVLLKPIEPGRWMIETAQHPWKGRIVDQKALEELNFRGAIIDDIGDVLHE